MTLKQGRVYSNFKLLKKESSGKTMIRILAFGNSLTEGFGLKREHSFASRVEERLRKLGFDCEVINGGVSGDTTYGGLKRIDWYLKDSPHLVLLELGINDGFLEYPIDEIKENLEKMIEKIKKIGAKIILIGTKIPEDFLDIPKEYSKKFEDIFYELAKEHNIPLCHDFLGGIIGNHKFTLIDNIHPNEEGVLKMVDKVIDKIIVILKEIQAGV